MPKASSKQSIVLPASGASSQAPVGEHEESSRQAGQENGRSSSLALDDSHADGGDGTSSAAAMQPHPVFYAGVMVRGQKSDLVRLFELPPTERLNGDFHCAMRKRVLLQGRMYVFDHYVCFYSAVFGFAKKRRMPMRTIKAVRKKKHLGFPNSLEIETDEYKEFFTSFLSREEAYQLIIKLLPESNGREETTEDLSVPRRGSTDTGSFTGGQGDCPNSQTRPGRCATWHVPTAGSAREVTSPRPRSRVSEIVRRSGVAGAGAAAAGGSAGGAGGLANGGGGAATANGLANGQRQTERRFNAEQSLLTRNSGSMADENDEEDEDGSGVWVAEQRPAPPIPNGTRHVLHCTLPGTPREFFDVVLADSAPFFEDFLDSQGNRRINLTTWKRHPQLGHVRDMNFTAPIKGAFGNWGVSHTACYQSQRFCLYSDEHIVFESSQTMTDIPYGDCFTVDQRWDIKRDPHAEPDRPQLIFDLHMRVPFSSRCLFKGVIESGSVKQVQDTFAQFVDQLRPVLQDRILSRNTLTMHDPNEPPMPTASVTPRIGSLAAGGQGLGASAAGARMMSLQRSTPTLRSQQGFDVVDQADGNMAFSRQAQHADTSVAGLLFSLGRRLAEGAGGMLESGVDVVLNLTQCRTTPQMRFLCAMVLIMFVANLLCMLVYMWPTVGGWAGRGGEAAAPAAAPAAAGGAAAPPSGAVLDAAAAVAGLDGGALAPYWLQRMSALQQELAFLQSRMEIVSREVGAVMTHLAQVSAPGDSAAASGTSATAAAAAAAAGEL